MPRSNHFKCYEPADCFGAALAKIKNAEFVTGDPEFKEVEKDIKINWLKQG